MKKFRFLLILFLVMTLFTGCGNKVKSSVTDNDNVVNDVIIESEDNSYGGISSLEEYVDMVRPSIQDMSNSTVTMDLELRDKSFVYVCTYVDTYPESSFAGMAEAIDNVLSSNSSVYSNLLAEMKKIDSNSKSVIVEYFNGDGALIFSKEFVD